MNKTKIIVVEDNIVYCEYVCNMLSREGYRTREGYRNMKAYHLSTAKKHLQQATDNDIVVADLRLPDGSGIDLLCWMRKEGKMQPFIIMTDYAEVNTAVESMKLGSIDYIPKQASHLWRWTAVHSPKSLHRRLSSDTSKVHLQVRTMPRKDISMRRKAARCFWTR